jgi:cytoskeletal protein RodZ
LRYTEGKRLPNQQERPRAEREKDMTEEVAGLLKQAREEKQLSLKDVESSTHVPVHYLQILEGGGDARLLADSLYLIPFLRTYSVFLGLDPAVTVAQFIEGMQKGEQLEGRPVPKLGRSRSRVVVALLILAGLVVLSFWWITGEHG